VRGRVGSACWTGHVVMLIVTAACWLICCHGAFAIDTCRGEYSGSLIHPLPSPNVVEFQPESNDPAELTDLGVHFLAGLQRGGLVMTGQPKTRLSLVTVVGAPVAKGPDSRYRGSDWARDTSASARSVISATLTLALTMINIQNSDTVWVGTLTCTILTNDKVRVVESLGELLGRAVGKDFPPTRF
jgi:hypothetical protein